MVVSRQTIDRLIALSEKAPRCGEWRAFCQREGVGYETLRYWRRKLSLRLRKKIIVNPTVNSYIGVSRI